MSRWTWNVLGRSCALALIVSGSLMTSACAQGEKAKPVPKQNAADAAAPKLWEDAPGYDLYVGKAEDPDARVLQSPDFQKLLILPGQGDVAWVLTLKTKDVASVDRTDVTAMV